MVWCYYHIVIWSLSNRLPVFGDTSKIVFILLLLYHHHHCRRRQGYKPLACFCFQENMSYHLAMGCSVQKCIAFIQTFDLIFSNFNWNFNLLSIFRFKKSTLAEQNHYIWTDRWTGTEKIIFSCALCRLDILPCLGYVWHMQHSWNWICFHRHMHLTLRLPSLAIELLTRKVNAA